jgi:hypothetical protein
VWGAEDYLRFADDTHSIRPNHLKRLVFIEDLQGLARLQLLADRDLASQFVEEVFEEDHLVLRLLCFRSLDWH